MPIPSTDQDLAGRRAGTVRIAGLRKALLIAAAAALLLGGCDGDDDSPAGGGYGSAPSGPSALQTTA